MTRSDRISSRVRPEQKERFEYAAALSGETLTEFLLHSAEERARRIISEHEIVALRSADAERLVSLLLQPPEPNAALRAAFKRHRTEIES